MRITRLIPMSKSKIAVAILVLLVTTIYLYQSGSYQEELKSLSGTGDKFTMAENSLLSELIISVRKTSSDPPALGVTVKNNNSVPVTILAWNSPLDPLALSLGVLSITPSGSSTPLDIPEIKVSRKFPPGEDALIELGAGQTSKENEVELKEMLVGKELREKQVEKAFVKCKGEWRAVWAVSRKDLDSESIEKMGTDEKASSGKYESDDFEIVFK